MKRKNSNLVSHALAMHEVGGLRRLAANAGTKQARMSDMLERRVRLQPENHAEVPRKLRGLEEYWSNTRVRSPVPGALGLLVTSASFRLLAATPEAVTILTYPASANRARILRDTRPRRQRARSVAKEFDKRLRQDLLRLFSQSNGHESPPALQLESGRRTYICRTFVLEAHGRTPAAAAVLVVLERAISRSWALTEIAQHFCLTSREQEVLELLLQGLGNKEMAERMGISTNTVKTLVHLVLVKMRVSSRFAVVAGILSLMLSAHNRSSQADE
jgi:DNA-binding NarL/FixJ family response regulator